MPRILDHSKTLQQRCPHKTKKERFFTTVFTERTLRWLNGLKDNGGLTHVPVNFAYHLSPSIFLEMESNFFLGNDDKQHL